MKKLLPIIVLFTFCIPMWAQKATLQDLQGKWKLVTYATINASLDIATGKATLTEGAKNLGEGLAAQLKSDMESYAENLQIAYVIIEGNNFTQVVFDSVKAGPFTISDKENYQVIDAKFDDGTTGSIYFVIKDGKLILFFPISNKSYYYVKEKK